MSKKQVYIGDSMTKEFHSIARQKPECNVDKIKSPVYFTRGRDARAAGFDACGHCTRYWKSRRNRD
jgi:hypothetical protein